MAKGAVLPGTAPLTPALRPRAPGTAQPRPRGPQTEAPGSLTSKGRQLIFEHRVKATIQEWDQSSGCGWALPATRLAHPLAQRNQGRVFVQKADVQGALKVGSVVDFLVYIDRGRLGAADVKLPAPTAPKAPKAKAQPVRKPVVDAEPLLPAGWEKIWSAEYELYYFWHRQRKESMWERPTEEPAEPAEPAEPQVPEELDGDPDLEELEVVDDVEAEPEEAEEEALPHGWEQHYDATHKAHYFWERATKTATWTRPVEKTPQKRAAPPETPGPNKVPRMEIRPKTSMPLMAKAAAPKRALQPFVPEEFDDAVIVQDPPKEPVRLLPTDRVSGEVLKWHGNFGWIMTTSDACDEHRPMLQKANGKVYASYRDLAPGVTLEAGAMVDFVIVIDESGLAAKDVKIHGPDVSQDSFGAPASPVELPLLPGWEEHWDGEENRPFYVHNVTRQSSWERPSIEAPPAVEVSASSVFTPSTPGVKAAPASSRQGPSFKRPRLRSLSP